MGFCYLVSDYYRKEGDKGSPGDQMRRNMHLKKKKKTGKK